MLFLFPCPAGTPPASFGKDSRTCLLPGCLPPHISDSGTVTASLYPCRTTYPQTYGKDAVRYGGSPLATRHHTNKCERTGPVSISYCKAGRPPLPAPLFGRQLFFVWRFRPSPPLRREGSSCEKSTLHIRASREDANGTKPNGMKKAPIPHGTDAFFQNSRQGLRC